MSTNVSKRSKLKTDDQRTVPTNKRSEISSKASNNNNSRRQLLLCVIISTFTAFILFYSMFNPQKISMCLSFINKSIFNNVFIGNHPSHFANTSLPMLRINSNSNPPTPLLKNSRKRVAFAITITKDGPFLDGAAVLAYSIFDSFERSIFDISLVAFVHPNVKSSRPILTRLGYHVIEATTPINISAIQFTFLREKINKNGCCGASELIKLNSYRLLQYERVVHIDADTMMINPIDELLLRNYSLIYTTDPNMATYKCAQCMPVQGGFLVLKPSDEDFRALIDTVMTTEFYKDHGWNRSNIGWFWGGMTVQGLLPYYYSKVTSPGRSQVVDRCYYNTMADTTDCSTQELHELKSAHFTVCQKPWTCEKQYNSPPAWTHSRLCEDLHKRWFEIRVGAERFYNISVNANPCPKGGKKHYTPMELDNAKLPEISYFGFDDSPDIFKPPAEARYITEDYDNTVGGHASALAAQQ